MKKFLKFLVLTILLILTLLILVPVIFKDKIVEIAKTEINNQVNAKVNFGEFDLSIFTYFPNLNFEINNVSVVGVDKFEEDTLMYLKQFSAKVDLMSVMSDEIKILAVHLVEPQLYAHVLPDTTANWDIAKVTEPSVESENPVAESGEEKPAAFNLALKEFSIQKANIVYQDESSNILAEVKDLDYSINGDFSLSTAKLKMNLLIEALTVNMEGVKYLNKTNIEYTAAINADLDKMRFDILDNKFRINKLVLALDGFLQMNQNSYDMDLSFATNDNQFKDLLSLVPSVYTKDYADIKTSGALKLGGYAKGIYSDNQLPAFNLNLNIDNASVQYPDLPTAITQIFVNLNIDNKDGVDDHTVIDLKRFDLDLAGNPFSAQYLTKTPISDPYIDGFVKGKIDFDKLKDAIPLDSMSISGLMTIDLTMKGNLSTIENEKYDEFDAKGNIALENFIYKVDDLDYDINIESTNFEVAPKYFTLQNFDAKVGRSDFHAKGQINNFLAYYFNDEVLSGSFNLNSSLIDGNELVGVDEESAAEADKVAEQTVENKTINGNQENAMEIVELPKNIDFSLNTNLKKILYDNYEIENFVGDVQLKEGVATMNPVKMNMIDGTLEMTGVYDSRDITAPQINFDFKVINFDIKKTFETFNTVKKIAPIAENCKGKISMNFKLKSLLDEHMNPIQKTMNGRGNIKSKSIVIGGSKSLEKLANMLKSDKYKQAELKNIDGTFLIENGNITISPVDVKWNNSKATFGGKQGIDQSLDYTLNVDIPRSELGNADQLIDGLMAKGGQLTQGVDLGKTINLDVFITGTVSEPKFSVGMKDMLNGVKDQLKEKVDELINKGKDKAIAEARKQAAALMTEADKQSKKLIAESEKQARAIRVAGKKAAQQAKDEANKQINDLIKKAGANPIAKMAAKESGKALKKEANKKANKIEQEANKKADQLVLETKKQTDNLKSRAKSEGDKLIEKATKL